MDVQSPVNVLTAAETPLLSPASPMNADLSENALIFDDVLATITEDLASVVLVSPDAPVLDEIIEDKSTVISVLDDVAFTEDTVIDETVIDDKIDMTSIDKTKTETTEKEDSQPDPSKQVDEATIAWLQFADSQKTNIQKINIDVNNTEDILNNPRNMDSIDSEQTDYLIKQPTITTVPVKQMMMSEMHPNQAVSEEEAIVDSEGFQDVDENAWMNFKETMKILPQKEVNADIGMIDSNESVTGLPQQHLTKVMDMNTQSNTIKASSETTLTIHTPIDDDNWSTALNEKITWIGHQKLDKALIQIHPESLGPIEIRLKMNKDGAEVSITTTNTHISQLVDAAMPKLKEMMASEGVQLMNVNVQSQSDFDQKRSDRQAFLGQDVDEVNQKGHSINANEVGITTPIRTKKSIIDYFA
jgi:flagellar hook-length control protein FliK